MQIELRNLEIFANEDDIRAIKPITDKYAGRTFDSHDELDKFVDKLERAFNVELSVTYCEHLTEEEEQEEWDSMISSCISYAETHGLKADHVIGMELAGI